MIGPETPITDGELLPDGVPLVASFHDDRNRLSYYEPILKQIVRTPKTEFFPVEGNPQSYLDIEYRDITQFLQSMDTTDGFVRSDFSAGKFDGEEGSKITSQDPYDIEDTVLKMFSQLNKGKRWIGGRIAVREWIEHNAEVRYFIRDGQIYYRDSLDEADEFSFPDSMAEIVAGQFDVFAWSLDFIREEQTGDWYAIDMGLDGLYPTRNGDWMAISEHLHEEKSPENYQEDVGINPRKWI